MKSLCHDCQYGIVSETEFVRCYHPNRNVRDMKSFRRIETCEYFTLKNTIKTECCANCAYFEFAKDNVPEKICYAGLCIINDPYSKSCIAFKQRDYAYEYYRWKHFTTVNQLKEQMKTELDVTKPVKFRDQRTVQGHIQQDMAVVHWNDGTLGNVRLHDLENVPETKVWYQAISLAGNIQHTPGTFYKYEDCRRAYPPDCAVVKFTWNDSDLTCEVVK